MVMIAIALFVPTAKYAQQNNAKHFKKLNPIEFMFDSLLQNIMA